MNNDITSFSEIIRRLGDKNLAAAIGAKPHQPRDWRIRDNIPSEWWESVVSYADDSGEPEITLDLMASLASRRIQVGAA